MSSTLLLIALVFYCLDIEEAWQVLIHSNLTSAALSALFFLLGSIAGGWAWLVILRRMSCSMSWGKSLYYTLVGFVLNNLLPGGVVGDFYRIYGAEREQISRADAAASVVSERWASLLSLLAATLFVDYMALGVLRQASLSRDWAPDWLPALFLRFDVLMSVTLLIVTIAFILSSWAIYQAVHQRQSQTESALGKEVSGWGAEWHNFCLSLGRITARPSTFFTAAAINLLSPVFEGLSYAFAAQAIGLELSSYLFLAFTPLFRIITHLPISVNAIGPQEILTLALWTPLGADPEDTLAISLLIHAVKIGISLTGLPLLFIREGRRHSQIPLHSPPEASPVSESLPSRESAKE